MTNKEGIIQELETFLQELKDYQYWQLLKSKKQLTRQQIEDIWALRDKLLRDAGRFRPLITELTGKEKIKITRAKNGRESEYDVWFTGLQQIFSLRAADAISYCVDITSAAIGRLEDDIKKGTRDNQGKVKEKTHVIETKPVKAFIAHEGETQALTSLKKLLEALGIKYFIAEAEASGGKSVEKHVNWVEEQGDFAIILATKGKAVDKKTGRYYMGLNVADELGSARQIYKNHIILLVQKGVQVHTNKREIVYGEFTSTNMQEAFIKIARELRNWGFIRAGGAK